MRPDRMPENYRNYLPHLSEIVVYNTPGDPVEYTAAEDGEWAPWHWGEIRLPDCETGRYKAMVFNKQLVYSFRFANGRVWDCWNHWRQDHVIST